MNPEATAGDDAGAFSIPADHSYGLSFLTAVDGTEIFAPGALVVGDTIFEDGFESGTTGAWAAAVP